MVLIIPNLLLYMAVTIKADTIKKDSIGKLTTITECPVHAVLEVLGGKWKIFIVWYISQSPRRFSELRRAMIGVTEKMLTKQLRELESDGIISRRVYPQIPPKVEYSMTKFGLTLKPVLKAMCKWGLLHKKNR